MFKTSVILVLAIFYHSSNTINGSEIRTLINEYNFSSFNSNMSTVDESSEKTTNVFTFCTSVHLKSERNCSTSVETTNFDHSSYEENCEFSVKPDTEKEIFSHFGTKLLGKTNLIVYWIEKGLNENIYLSSNLTLQIRILDFKSCFLKPVAELKIPSIVLLSDDGFFVKKFTNIDVITPSADKFDIIFRDSHWNLRKSSWDKDGNQISDISWLLPYEKAACAFFGLKNEGYLVVMTQDKASEISLVYDNINSTSLAKYDENESSSFVVSTANDKISYCHSLQPLYEWKSITCHQYDLKLNKLLEKKWNIGYKTDQLFIHNSIKSGLLVVTSKNLAFKSNSNYHFTITKLDAERQYKSLGIKGSACGSDIITDNHLFQNDEKEYCLTLRCNRTKNYKIIIKCFSEELVSIPL